MTRNFFKDFEMLLDEFKRLVERARELESPNRQDDLLVRTAIVGFSFNQPTEEWGWDHLQFLRGRAQDPTDGEADFGSSATRIYSALAVGFLLGLYQAGSIDDEDFRIAEAQLAGFIALNLDEISRSQIS